MACFSSALSLVGARPQRTPPWLALLRLPLFLLDFVRGALGLDLTLGRTLPSMVAPSGRNTVASLSRSLRCHHARD